PQRRLFVIAITRAADAELRRFVIPPPSRSSSVLAEARHKVVAVTLPCGFAIFLTLERPLLSSEVTELQGHLLGEGQRAALAADRGAVSRHRASIQSSLAGGRRVVGPPR